ncbi:MAG: DUF1343 domain-containing protein [Treponema sp.]|jgi:uncharacterized protein YbbC (DUF1343 family)|nr:DUF1343 domain-containing protein [Treponema sp.]
MVSFSSVPLWDDPDPVLRDGRLGLLCNHAAWHQETGEYLFETLHARGNLKRVFIPEHGLFGELQDQVKLDDTGTYSELGFGDCEFVSLYGSGESSLTVDPEKLAGLDALVIELQDVGVRYYTFLATLRNLFIALKVCNIPLPVWVLDRENPAGSSVEGTPLKEGYGSFIGIEGLPHRYGLSIGELAHYFYAEIGADFPLRVISWRVVGEPRLFPWTIPPSPNIPGYFTAWFYSGQCLWEGTNVSEGRGTTRPFEVFGAPWMEELVDYNRRAGLSRWNAAEHPLADPGVFLRWHRFIPVFHKYRDRCCFGFQLILREDEARRDGFPNPAYHALFHALRLIRFMVETCEDFSFRPGKYEAGNDKTAIELLTGDPVLLDYLEGRGPASADIREYLRREEEGWIQKVRGYRFYEEVGSFSEPLYSAAGRIKEWQILP